MFQNLSDRLGEVLHKVRGQGRITETNVKDTLREVRMALLEADVALPVVKTFVDQVREKALGEEVMKSLTPGQALVKIVNDELVSVMGEANQGLNLAAQPPAVVMVAGLQGSGKTTSVAKLPIWRPSTSCRPWRARSGWSSIRPMPCRCRSRSHRARWTRRAGAFSTCCWWTPPAACTSTSE